MSRQQLPAQAFVFFGTLKAARRSHQSLLHAMLRYQSSSRSLVSSRLIVVVVINRAPMAFFDTTPLGRIINRFSRDQFVIDEKLTPVLYSWLRQVFAVLAVLFAIVYVTPIFLLPLLPLVYFYWRVQDFYIASSRELKRYPQGPSSSSSSSSWVRE